MFKINIKNFKHIIKSWHLEDSFSFYLSFCKIPIKLLSKIFLALTPTVIINSIETHSNLFSTLSKIFIICCFVALLLLFEPIIDERLNFSSTKLKYYYKKKIFKEIYRQKYDCAEETYLSRILNFVDINYKYCIQNFPHKLINLLTNLLGLFSYIILFAKLNKFLILVLIITSLIDFYIMYRFHDMLIKNENIISPIKSQLNYLYSLSKDFSVGKELRLYNFRDWFTNLHNNNLISYKDLLFKQNCKTNKFFLISSISKLTRNIFIVLVLFYNLYKGSYLISDFVFLGTLAIGFSDWIKNIAQEANEITHICSEYNLFSSYFTSKSSSNFRNKIHIDNTISIETIEFKHVTFTYPNTTKPVINDISFKIHKDENIAIVGRNGSGKTTCIKLLCGVLKPTSGSIYLNGIDIYDYYEEDYIKLFSTIFQHFHVLPLNIIENISLCDETFTDNSKLNQALIFSGVDKFSSELKDGLHTRLVEEVNKDGVKLSGGELQKLVIARMLYKDSPIIIFDEPTAALDPLSENELYQKYHQLSKNKTTLFISHRLASTNFCDSILVIDNGSLAEMGSHKDLMKHKGIYYKLYELQKNSFN